MILNWWYNGCVAVSGLQDNLEDQELKEYTDPALAITRNNKGFAVPRVGDANPD